MKKLITLLALSLAVAWPSASYGQNNIESDPAYLPIDKVIDLKAIPPQVDVNLPRFLLKDALSGLTNGAADALAKNGINVADLIKDVKLIRVVVIEASETNRAALAKSMKALQSSLSSKWTAIVNVPEDNVGIYAMSDASGESNSGLAVLIFEDSEAVIVNIVGHVSIGKVLQIAAQSNKLPKDLLKNFGKGTPPAPQPAVKTDDSASTNQPVEAVPAARPKEAATK
jgi:hypothetical protein